MLLLTMLMNKYKLNKSQRRELISAVFQGERTNNRIIPHVYYINWHTRMRLFIKILVICAAIFGVFELISVLNRDRYLTFELRSVIECMAIAVLGLLIIIVAARDLLLKFKYGQNTLLYAKSDRYLNKALTRTVSLKLIKIHNLGLYKKLFFACFVGRDRVAVDLINTDKVLAQLSYEHEVSKLNSRLIKNNRVLSEQVINKLNLELDQIDQKFDKLLTSDVERVYMQMINDFDGIYIRDLPDDLYEKVMGHDPDDTILK